RSWATSRNRSGTTWPVRDRQGFGPSRRSDLLVNPSNSGPRPPVADKTPRNPTCVSPTLFSGSYVSHSGNAPYGRPVRASDFLNMSSPPVSRPRSPARAREAVVRPPAPLTMGSVLGVPLALTDYDETLEWMDAMIAS